MTLILGVVDFKARMGQAPLPLNDEGEVDDAQVEAVLLEATGLVVMHCPFVLAGEELMDPLPGQFAEGLRAVCLDLARHRLSDTLRDSEDARLAYKESINMLRSINKQQEVTLATPAEQLAEVIDDQGTMVSTVIDEFFGPPERIW